jgi:hypothetical protein
MVAARVALAAPALWAALAALAHGMVFRILAAAGAATMTPATRRGAVGAITLGVAFPGEAAAARQALGMGLIGLAAIDRRPAAAALRLMRRRRAGKPPPPPA